MPQLFLLINGREQKDFGHEHYDSYPGTVKVRHLFFAKLLVVRFVKGKEILSFFYLTLSFSFALCAVKHLVNQADQSASSWLKRA